MAIPTPTVRPRPRTLEQATAADAMTTGVVSCAPETPLREIAETMAQHGVPAVFVCDDGRGAAATVDLWGTVSELDVVAAACGEMDAMTAHESVVTPLETALRDEPLADSARRMAETGVSHLAVLDPETRRPVGLLTALDIVRWLAAGAGPASER